MKKIFSLLGMMLLVTACEQNDQDQDSTNVEMTNTDMQRGDKKDMNGRNSTRQQMNKAKPAKNNGSCGTKCDKGSCGEKSCGDKSCDDKSCGPCCDNSEAMLEDSQDIESGTQI